MKKEKKDKIEKIIKELLEPFAHHKYGKTYIGEEKTEGWQRAEGFVIHFGHILEKYID